MAFEDTYRQRSPAEYESCRMDVGVILMATFAFVLGRLIGRVMQYCLRSDASRIRRALAAAAAAIGSLAMAFVISKVLAPLPRNMYSFSTNILFTTVGIAMGGSFAKIVQNCVRMDISRALVDTSTIRFAMVWLLTKILHNYVIRMDVSLIIGNAMGYILDEIILQKLFERPYHGFKNRQLFQASLQVLTSNTRCLRVRASYLRFRQALLQAHIHELQGADPAHQLPELHELCLEIDALCHEVIEASHELRKMCHELHQLCNCTRLCIRLNEDDLANAFGGNNDGQPRINDELAAAH